MASKNCVTLNVTLNEKTEKLKMVLTTQNKITMGEDMISKGSENNIFERQKYIIASSYIIYIPDKF